MAIDEVGAIESLADKITYTNNNNVVKAKQMMSALISKLITNKKYGHDLAAKTIRQYTAQQYDHLYQIHLGAARLMRLHFGKLTFENIQEASFEMMMMNMKERMDENNEAKVESHIGMVLNYLTLAYNAQIAIGTLYESLSADFNKCGSQGM